MSESIEYSDSKTLHFYKHVGAELDKLTQNGIKFPPTTARLANMTEEQLASVPDSIRPIWDMATCADRGLIIISMHSGVTHVK